MDYPLIAAESKPKSFAAVSLMQGSPTRPLRPILIPGFIGPEGVAMSQTYNTVDADGHILEPLTLWDDYIDPAFRDRSPRHVIDEHGAAAVAH